MEKERDNARREEEDNGEEDYGEKNVPLQVPPQAPPQYPNDTLIENITLAKFRDSM